MDSSNLIRLNNASVPQIEYTCRRCKVPKHETLFYPSARKNNGLCKVCSALVVKEWRKNNPQKAKETRIKYTSREEVRKKMIEQHKKYYNTPLGKETYHKCSINQCKKRKEARRKKLFR